MMFIIFSPGITFSQTALPIPDTLTGLNINLSIYDTSHTFYSGIPTSTYGVNASYLGPTLILNKHDSVTVSFFNSLTDTTTIHWHGMHVSPANDGGPHIVIPPGTVWSPSFKVRDNAAMYWYHPHMHMKTNLHAALGAAGLVIVRDSAEKTILLPRSYGADDFPLVLQTKCFDNNKQIQINNPYDSTVVVNGAIKPLLTAPAQVIRLRMLNASSERVLNIGFSANQTFYLIGTDGGLLNAPLALTRLMLAPGERADILLNLTGMTGQNLSLLSYASELANAIYGAAQPGMGAGQVIPGYTSNPLNEANFTLLSIAISTPTSNPVTAIPASLVQNTPWQTSQSNASKILTFTPVNMGPTAIQGPFLINNAAFNMGVINYHIPKNNIEIWTLSNQTPIAHPFHIHDVQFYITEYNGAAPPPHLLGRKDVVLVPAMQTVKFITKFETFCDPMYPYMYHCHMLTHEDDGMMGQFVVECPSAVQDNINTESLLQLTPVPTNGLLHITTSLLIESIAVYDVAGKLLYTAHEPEETSDISFLNEGLYFLHFNTSAGLLCKKVVIKK